MKALATDLGASHVASASDTSGPIKKRLRRTTGWVAALSSATKAVDGTGDDGIVETTVNLGERLGLTVIAEGVEDVSQVEWLGRLGCRFAQDHYFSIPITPQELEEKLPAPGNSTQAQSRSYLSA